jgi:hypothetical protein
LAVLILSAIACGGGTTAVQRPAARPRAKTSVVGSPLRLDPGRMFTTGLTGSLSTGEVREALAPRDAEFSACFTQLRGHMQPRVGGRIELAFRVDADGRVMWARPVDSTLGNRRVERCLLEVAAATEFPAPHGGYADFTWPLELDASSEPASLDPSRVAGAVRRQRRDLADRCDLERAERFQITTYVTGRGRVLSVGGVASDRDADDRIDCVVRAVRGWRLPRHSRPIAKVTSEI